MVWRRLARSLISIFDIDGNISVFFFLFFLPMSNIPRIGISTEQKQWLKNRALRQHTNRELCKRQWQQSLINLFFSSNAMTTWNSAKRNVKLVRRCNDMTCSFNVFIRRLCLGMCLLSAIETFSRRRATQRKYSKRQSVAHRVVCSVFVCSLRDMISSTADPSQRARLDDNFFFAEKFFFFLTFLFGRHLCNKFAATISYVFFIFNSTQNNFWNFCTIFSNSKVKVVVVFVRLIVTVR